MESIKIKTLEDLLNNKHKYKVSKEEGHQGVKHSDYDREGEYDEYFIFYKHPDFPKEYLLRETYRTDSYGQNDYIVKTEFVKAKEKSIVVYEPY